MDPVYGQKDTPYTEFMAPGLIISQVFTNRLQITFRIYWHSFLYSIRIIYFMAVSLTAGAFVAERKQGLLDRSLVAGICHSN
jgi:hypothetical protein